MRRFLSREERIKKAMKNFPMTDTGLVNKLGHNLILNKIYRFKWQTTNAHWYLRRIEGEKAFMESKHHYKFIGKIDDLIPKGVSIYKRNIPNE